jgi:hypothetical protein
MKRIGEEQDFKGGMIVTPNLVHFTSSIGTKSSSSSSFKSSLKKDESRVQRVDTVATDEKETLYFKSTES